MDILICVGASEYGFERLLKIVDELCDEKKLDGKHIISQLGSSSYLPHNFKYFKLIGRNEYEKYVEQADVIISHAGTGSVIPPLKKGKKVIVFPRRECYGEHLDDHQLELANIFTQNGYTLCATNKAELQNCLSNIKNFVPRPFESNTRNMNKLIIDFIENVFR
ncbi:MAG: hypothetical protein KH057_09290 [Bacteroides sp.]|nr:hypothetical protein [Bacteroides sp.]